MDATSLPSDRSAAAMRLDDQASAQPWYLTATPLATLPWLVRLRWTSAAIETAAALFGWLLPHLDFPLRRLAPLILVAAASNVLSAVWLSRQRALPRLVELVSLAVDALLLAGLLELTGGPFNPFSVVFAVQVTLAALTLGRLPASIVGGLATASYVTLVYWHTREVDPVHHRLNDFPTHLFTMWIAVAATAELIAYFVLRASNALAQRERQLEAMRQQAARTARVMSMTTLAAGAAHELSTPLATIALASKELERSASALGTAALVEDARLIRGEVDRCRAILDQMSGRAGGVTADDPEAVDIRSVVDEVRSRLSRDQAAHLEVTVMTTAAPVYLPRAGFGQTLLTLVKNAFDATGNAADARVFLDVTHQHDRLRITVTDHGQGMAPDVLHRAGEPFFTTKEAGRGLGLGLFLARVFAERTGGSLTLQSDRGTTATLELPARTPMGTA
jgi:two-component system sensor histidine kinase RegB